MPWQPEQALKSPLQLGLGVWVRFLHVLPPQIGGLRAEQRSLPRLCQHEPNHVSSVIGKHRGLRVEQKGVRSRTSRGANGGSRDDDQAWHSDESGQAEFPVHGVLL